MNAEKVHDYPGDDVYVMFDLGDRDVGVVNVFAEPLKMEIWHDHRRSGSGCNNWIIDAFGRELDLEFCRSRSLTRDELKLFLETEGAAFYNTGNPALDALRRNVSGMVRAGLAEAITAM